MIQLGNILGSATLSPNKTDNEWSIRLKVSFTANATVLKAKMNLWFEGNGVIDLDMISLFPTDTWKNRPGGMRADMIQKLADMKPGFHTFPRRLYCRRLRSFTKVSMEKNNWSC